MNFSALEVIQPWQIRLYVALASPSTLATATRSVEHFDARRTELQARGDAKAVAGASKALRLAVLRLAAVQADTHRQLMRKLRSLASNRAVWAHDPLAAAMIETAVAADAVALGLPSDEETRLRQLVRGEP